jgi:hypothetical protein
VGNLNLWKKTKRFVIVAIDPSLDFMGDGVTVILKLKTGMTRSEKSIQTKQI